MCAEYRKFGFKLVLFLTLATSSIQKCPEEVAETGLKVTWPESYDGENLDSSPLCYDSRSNKIRRNCSESVWSPPLSEVAPCFHVTHQTNNASCPPGFNTISQENADYCYETSEPSEWNSPCYKSGGATTITDLNSQDLNTLLDKLNNSASSRYYWLPAQRLKTYNPLIWTIPGPNWGKVVEPRASLPLHSTFIRSCLLLDVKYRRMTTESCSKIYPSMCFYLNEIYYPAKCPDGYHSFRFMPDKGTCFGIEHSDSENGSTFDTFLETKCQKPMADGNPLNITSFIYSKMAQAFDIGNQWCWFFTYEPNSILRVAERFQGIINSAGTLGLAWKSSKLSCMACETEMSYGETELHFEYNEFDEKFYLSVYLPSGLWRYNETDKGVRCFSNAKGFAQAVSISNKNLEGINDTVSFDKIVYEVYPVTERLAQYWCEGHVKNFSLISTQKVIANPKGNTEHVFALCVRYGAAEETVDFPDIANVADIIANMTDAKKVILMDVLDYENQQVTLVYHIHVVNNAIHNNQTLDMLDTFKDLSMLLNRDLPKKMITFVNMSSVLYCLPTTSEDIISLDWELTPLNHIAIPKQFCLQSNGLPVNRRCMGSYIVGTYWGPVDGTCDEHYEPTNKTTFLYNFIKGNVDNDCSERFLTDGLNFVLDNVSLIIPADIYYLSSSLKQITTKARDNRTALYLGDLENIAWVADRLMILNSYYLNLAQTLNSTNVILESVTAIIELLAFANDSQKIVNNAYQIAVQPQFVAQISFPIRNNITGMAVIKNNLSDLFTDMLIKPLYLNSSLEEVIAIENLELATWIPKNVFDSLKVLNNTNQSESYIIINMFRNDAIFQEVDERRFALNSRIVEIEIPGFSTNLLQPIPIVFRTMQSMSKNSICGYWDIQDDEKNIIPGTWKRDGCFYFKNAGEIVVCKCYHMTHFAQLISAQDAHPIITKTHRRALNIVTLIGSFLSLIGITGIWVTACLFSVWRKKAGTKVLLQLSAAIAIPLIVMIVFSLHDSMFTEVDGLHEVSDNKITICIILGAILHYAILAAFVWMLITAILQFVRYVRVIGVQRPSRFMIKLSLLGWGVPALPVVTILAINKDGYLPDPSIQDGQICYPSGLNFIFGVLIPIVLIIIINLALFVSVIISITKGPNGVIRTSDLDLVKAQLRLSIFLFFLLGLTWIFGIMSFSPSLFWSYLFCLTTTIQGFVLFVYFIICDPATRNLWVTFIKPPFKGLPSRASVTSFSS